MNKTVNGSSCSSLPNTTARKIGQTFAFCLIFVVSLVGNSFIGIVVYKTQTLRKPINYFIANMALSGLLYPIVVAPVFIVMFVDGSSLQRGPFGQVLCKLVTFFWLVSIIVSIQSLVLIAVDRFGAVVFPLRSPLVSLLHSRHVDHCSGRLLAIFSRLRSCCIRCIGKVRPCLALFIEAIEESSSCANYT